MSITLDDLSFLSSDAGERVLSRLADEDLRDERTLALITSLRRDLSGQQAGAALELARLRKKAVSKFGDDASKLYFTREALEQASDPLIRGYRARSFSSGWQIVDACCGIGADSLAFAQAGAEVTGLDIDPVRVEMAGLNAQALRIENAHFEVADVREGVPVASLVFFDPARRDEQGKRIFDVEKYQPPLSLVREFWAMGYIAKLSPGVDMVQLEPYKREGAFVTFVSVNGDLKEALLNQDYLPGGYDTAVLITENCVYERDNLQSGETAPISEPRGWLVEPDPAIIRAGLVADVAIELGGAQLDPEIAYITTDEKPDSPWVRA